MKPAVRCPVKRLVQTHKEKIKGLSCHWSGNEDEQVCGDLPFSGLDHVNVDVLAIFQVIDYRRKYSFPRNNFTKMSSDRQRSDDESPSTSSGSSDADQRDPAAPEPEEQEERKPSATQQKKNTKLSSKTTAKLSTSAKRIQKELAEITLDPPPNCSRS
ncbi:hypothetical protein CB1_000644019 [Camelus ferus]|nr:hypothetical protein CB1_000644019 [Camelus ferus]